MNWITVFTYVPFAVFALTFALFVLPQKLTTKAQARWAMFLLFCFAKFLCFAAFGGHAFSPDLPELLIWFWDWLYSGAMILFALALVTVFVRRRWKLWALPAMAWGLSAWGLYNGVRVPSVHEAEVAFADLPPSLDGYRIVLLADLHCSSSARRWRTEAIVERVNALEADLVCLTGDNADGYAGRIARHLDPIRKLRAKDGVYACTGNHEYYHGFYDWLSAFYRRVTNLQFLSNECAFPHSGLALGGVPDIAGWYHDGIDVVPDARQAFAAATNGEFRILLQHRPKDARENVRGIGVRLQLSGHTHGGIAPLFRDFIARFNGGFVRGLYPLDNAFLYVSPGCGQWSGFPMRFFNDSEITLLVLRKAARTASPMRRSSTSA